MKTITKIISRLYVPILLFIFILNSSCSDDPSSPTKTEEEIPTTTATIGAAGGTFGTDDVLITIPAGAFNSENEIAIYDFVDDGAFGEYSISPSFKISGIPYNFTKPLKIKMKYSGDLSEQSFVAVGTKTPNDFIGDTSIAYTLYTAKDSSGFLIGELPASSESAMLKNENLLDAKNIKEEIYVKLSKGYKTKITQNFEIFYPAAMEAYINSVEEIFESTLEIIRNELEINFYPPELKGGVLLKFQDYPVIPKLDIEHGTIFNISIEEVIADFVSNSKLKTIVSNSLIRRESWYRSYKVGASALFWYEVAVRTWMEELLTSNSNFISPEYYPEYGMAPFNGLRAGAGYGSTEEFGKMKPHGIGMSSVVKYLVEDERFGRSGIGKTFEGVSKTAKTTTSLLNTMDANVGDWWPDFFKDYVSGKIYNRSINYFLDSTHGNWTISDSLDTMYVFTNNYRDLSARIYQINIDYADFEDTDRLLFRMLTSPQIYDELSLIVFGTNKNGNLEWLNTARAQDFEIPNLKSYYDDGMKQFLVVLVNSNYTYNNYLGTAEIDLLVEVKKQLKLDYTKCLMALKFKGNVLVDYVSIPDQYTTIVGMSQNASTGSFSGNTFYGSFIDGGETGSLTVTLNDELNLVTEMTWSGRMEYSNSTTELGFSAVNIPISSTLNNMYIIRGSNTCGVITDVYYQNISDTKTSTLIDYTCDEFSYIEILFD